MASFAAGRPRRLPVQQLVILSLCRFAEPLASTSLYPYLPEMIESFKVNQADVGRWVGVVSAIFSTCQAIVGIPWGRFSDVYGRKPAILLGLTSTMIMTLVWGFSTSLTMALVSRALAGVFNGNVGILRTTVAEMVPFKELQPRAFSIMPMIWSIGSIFGPSIGGALANPLGVRPEDRGKGTSLFAVFPYALPNMVNAGFFAFSIIVGILFLEETLETRRGHRDAGLRLGDKIKVGLRVCYKHLITTFRSGAKGDLDSLENSETEPLLDPNKLEDEENDPNAPSPPKPTAPTFREVLTTQAIINLIVYTLLACHSLSFDALLPVYLHYPPIGSHGSTPFTPPLKFAGGFGLRNFEIGLMTTCYGIAGMIAQFTVFPPLCRRYGALFWLKVVAVAFPLVYAVVPFTALIEDHRARIAAALVTMFLKCLCGIFAFPCSTILLTNSASSLRTLGTLNGFAVTFAAIGRAAGPVTAGAVFTAAVKRGYVVVPWWYLAALAGAAAVPVFWLVEGEGFGNDDAKKDDDVVEEDFNDASVEDDALRAVAAEGVAETIGGKPGPVTIPEVGDASVIDETDDTISPEPLRRRFSTPIGTGMHGVGRRYSDNLGQSLGAESRHA